MRVTLNYCFPNTRESMWNGYNSVHKEPLKLSMTCNTPNEFTPVTVWKPHYINYFLDLVRFKDDGGNCEKLFFFFFLIQ